MKALRVLLLLILGAVLMLAYDVLTALIGSIRQPIKHDMLGFGIYVYYTGWAFVVLLPLSIGLGELWWKDRKRFIPHVALLIVLMIWSHATFTYHPFRTLLFLVCALLSLPLRWVIQRYS